MKLIACLALQIWLVLLLKAEGGISAKSSDEGANEVVEGIQDRFRSNFDAASRIPISIESTMSNSVEQQIDQADRDVNQMMGSIMEDAQGYFQPELPRESLTTQRKAFKWDESTKTNFAKHVFESFILPMLGHPKEYGFEKLIFAVLCPVASEYRVILQMKISRLLDCTKDEAGMAEVDICSDWKYGDTQFHRLGIPEHVAKSKSAYLLYNPPVVGNLYNGSTASKDPKTVKMPVNPKGKTGIAGQGMLRSLGENIMDIPIVFRKVGKYREVLITDQEGKEHTNGPLPMFYESSMQSGKRYGRSEPSAEGYFSSLVKPEFKKKCNSETFRLALRFSREVPQVSNMVIY
ncbi:hypothetical protein M514_05012 [Trichuris suis]|uniref:Uncharacterized protein n=1 Tax=Trichuris suis TaxID=68888 RepID=A0A085NCY7_9BILA|nr:hypothetical protein M514_05012 [Trichuris suis]